MSINLNLGKYSRTTTSAPGKDELKLTPFFFKRPTDTKINSLDLPRYPL